MKVTRPVIVIADLYFSWTLPSRSQKKMVLAIMEANVKESELYTRSNCPAVTANMTMVLLFGDCASRRKSM